VETEKRLLALEVKRGLRTNPLEMKKGLRANPASSDGFSQQGQSNSIKFSEIPEVKENTESVPVTLPVFK
jgi:hypothetical protein